ncbi:MAG: adenylate/guanylate cyclase domain-containing protein, partial [Saprospiraceae bacterium]|nr:adenylate/guanylate cyclase domain-containing protein [Saprospiraceae bacterium]
MRKLSVIVFTDIEGYTALMQANEPAAQVARDRLRDATRELVPKMDGEIIQFLGDGFINTFSSTLQAINCAISLQKSLRQPPIIPVRIGIHQGEVTFVDDSVFGNAVNIASRVESLASSGSVLISESVFIEIANIPTIKTRFFGRFHFKNVRNPMKIYAVEDSHLVLPKEAHALAKLAGSATAALPVFVDEFIGREVLLEELAHTIRSSQNKIVSILGAGGLGKTRLAVATASTLSSSYRDGIAFVPLDAIENETLLLPGIGMALGLKENAEFSWNYLITEYLQDQQLL